MAINKKKTSKKVGEYGKRYIPLMKLKTMPNTHLTLTQLQAVLKVFEMYDVSLVDYTTLKGITPETFIQIVEEIQEVLTEKNQK